MRVLHLFSNYKWTGPAEPALGLCCALREQGVETEFACAPDSGNQVNMVVTSARARGVEPVLAFHLRKHRHPVYNFQDARRLRRYVAERAVDLVHCHLDNDHDIAARALRGSNVPLLRSSYEGVGLKPNRRRGRMIAETAVLVEPSEIARSHDCAAYTLRPDQAVVIPNVADIARFDPARELPDARPRWGIRPEAYVVGIVARMQTHRHFGDLLQALHLLSAALPQSQLLIVGRGTHRATVVDAPARALGLEGRVHVTGYLAGDDYVAAIQAMDAAVYLVPGSDGTCRAARELMAMGKPLVVADRGMLREIVEDGVSGHVTDGSAAALCAALSDLGLYPEKRKTFAARARARAESQFVPAVQASRVKALYERLLGR